MAAAMGVIDTIYAQYELLGTSLNYFNNYFAYIQPKLT